MPIFHPGCSGFDIVVEQYPRNIRKANAGHRQHLLLRRHQNLFCRQARHIDHRHFGQLLNPLFDDRIGQFTHLQKGSLMLLLTLQTIQFLRQVQVKHRNICCASLDHPRTFDLFGNAIHRRIDLFVDLDKSEVGIGTIGKT